MKMEKYLLWGVMVLILAGCLEDKNDFNYQQINKIDDFDVKNVEKRYSCFLDETLHLNPDVKMTFDNYTDLSYEWYLENKLVGQEREFDFKADKTGVFDLLFVAVDNRSGVRFPYEITVRVENRGLKGWLVLSRTTANASRLSVVWSRLTNYYKKDINGEYLLDDKGERISVDTVLYEGEYLNFVPNLGKGPRRLVENFAYKYHYYPNMTFWDDEIMVVQDDRCVELNGEDYSAVNYAGNEFVGGFPADFQPIDAALSWGCKCLLNRDGYCYLSVASVATDLHSGRYSSDPAFAARKFKAVYPANKAVGPVSNYFLLLDNRNSFYGCADNAFVNSNEPLIDIRHNIGELCPIAYHSKYSKYFRNLKYDVICCHYDTDLKAKVPWWVCILREKSTGKYFVHTFSLELDKTLLQLKIKESYCREVSSAMFTNYSDVAVFPHKDYFIVANGDELWICYYNESHPGTRLGSTGGKQIVSLAAKDLNSDKYGGAHLGVGLEGGEVRVYEVITDYATDSHSLRELYKQGGFGDITDMIFKYGSASNLTTTSLF